MRAIGPDLAATISDFLRRCDERKFMPGPPCRPMTAAATALKFVETAQARIAEQRRQAAKVTRRMNGNFEFQYPWLLGLLALLPVYAFLHGRIGKLSALRFPAPISRGPPAAAARAAAGRLLMFLRLLRSRFASLPWPARVLPTITPKPRPAAWISCSCSICHGP